MKSIATMLAVLLVIGAAGCSKKEETPDKTAVEETVPAPEITEAADQTMSPILTKLKNTTYHGIQEQDPVTLKDGLWEGEPSAEEGAAQPHVRFLRNFHMLGDLDGDGQDEAAVLLSASSGGPEENVYLAVLGTRDGELRNLDTVLLGDHVQIRKSGIVEGRLFMDILKAGPEDEVTSPGSLEGAAWRLNNDKLEAMEAASAPLRLSLESIGDTEWVLRWWDCEEAAPAGPEVTLFFKDGRLGGSSGCNNYFAAANIGDKPGDISMGQAGGTRKMCPEEIMAVEQRFLAQMDGVKKFGFVAGMLALHYDFDGDSGVMLFEGRKPEQ